MIYHALSVIYFFQNDLDDPERGMIFVCSATHKTKVSYFCWWFKL